MSINLFDGPACPFMLSRSVAFLASVACGVFLITHKSHSKVDKASSSHSQGGSSENINTSKSDVAPSLKDDHLVVIGIAGGSGSGKTTLARAIYDKLGHENITYLTHDYYYKDLSHLSEEERDARNFDHPDALDTSLLVEHLKQLRRGEVVNTPRYDFGTHTRIPTPVVTHPSRVILIEGILIFCDPELHSLIDIKIYVDTDDDIRFIRRLQRDITERDRTPASVISQYMKTVRPMHLQFVQPSKRIADIVVPDGLNSVVLDMILSRLRQSMHGKGDK